MNWTEILICIFCILGTGVFFFVLKAMKDAPLYETCLRCGSDLPAAHVYETDCDVCKNISDESAKSLLKSAGL
jgi:hypothetical protein